MTKKPVRSAEKRRAPRKGLGLTGLIVDAAELVIGSCKIVNISHTGAKLALDGPFEVPDSFILQLSAGGQVRRQCDVVWRAKQQIGVQFMMARSAESRSFVDQMLSNISPSDQS
jgi:hypothetical protein